MANALKYTQAVHGVFTLYYRFEGRDQGHCVVFNAVDEADAGRQARRYYIRQRKLADAALYDPDGEIVADGEDLRHVRLVKA